VRLLLTARQKQLLDFIAAETARTGGVPPTVRQMMLALGFKSKGGVARVIDACVRDGILRRLKGKRQAIEIIKPTRAAWFAFDEIDKVLKPLRARACSADFEVFTEEASA
jgi:SOS-response transcriptional repressor LexA